jgi:hypothetical protein
LTAIIGLLAAIAVPNFLMARDRAERDLCIYNLGRIDSAKGAWALQYGGGSNIEPTSAELKKFFRREIMPTCPAGGEYEIGFLYEPPFCTLEDLGHLYLPFGDDVDASPAPNGNGNGAPGGAHPPWAGSPGGNGTPGGHPSP